MTDADREMVAQVMADLEAEHASTPAKVFYELRGDPERRDVPQRLAVKEDPYGPAAPGTLWERARWAADLLSGGLCSRLRVYQVRVFENLMGRETRREESYVVTSCGGGPYWQEGPEGPLHQIGSAGFCWTCLQPDPDLDQARRGLVRHPVTPDEIGRPAYRCHVCGEDMTDGRDLHQDIEHLVIWGEETHPRCDACGRGYQTASREGIGYAPHDPSCPRICPKDLGRIQAEEKESGDD